MSDGADLPKVAQLTVTRKELALLLNGTGCAVLMVMNGLGFTVSEDQKREAAHAVMLALAELTHAEWKELDDRMGALLASSFGEDGRIREVKVHNTQNKDEK